MAKYGPKTYVGQIKKRKDGTGDYFQASADFTIKKGMYLNLEKPQDQIKNIMEAVSNGKMTEEKAEPIVAKLNKDIEMGTRFTVTHQDITKD